MSNIDNQELDRMLQAAFDASTRLYQERGFQRRVGFGKRPALISVDLANAWTRPGNPFTCDQEKMAPPVNRHANLTPSRRPKMTPLERTGSWPDAV